MLFLKKIQYQYHSLPFEDEARMQDLQGMKEVIEWKFKKKIPYELQTCLHFLKMIHYQYQVVCWKVESAEHKVQNLKLLKKVCNSMVHNLEICADLPDVWRLYVYKS